MSIVNSMTVFDTFNQIDDVWVMPRQSWSFSHFLCGTYIKSSKE
jgi:hypothetical protein